ncbi:M17 family metallopeptidase [Dactylosporangium sp. NPDC048998]|uniref:M17 family metallopeptidase n=1 Tax=Dactylosporangium sp. NPDC048998 TaxID=3363976 RepID=UPI0037206557
MPTPGVPPPTPRRPARAWAAEIDQAIDAVVDGAGPVAVAADAPIARRIAFVTRDDRPADAGAWLPFGAEVGELSADGDVLRVGLGPATSLTAERARRAAAVAGARLSTGPVAVQLPDGRSDLVPALIDGLVTGCRGIGPVTLHVAQARLADAERGRLDADVARLARLLVNAPANVLTPRTAADWAQRIARRAGLGCTVLGPQQVVESGFGGLAAVGAGSANGPHLVQLEYSGTDPGSGPAAAPDVALVGKGITFDSGGLSLKSPAAMQAMRMDTAGAAAVLAVMAGLRRGRCAMTVRAVLPFAENLPGPGAVRPGDAVTAWNGTQIQILDTDFEGRVVLADALALAASARPGLLVDLATLTYQAEIALGPQIAAVLGRDDAAVARVLRAGAAAGEPLWRLPWAERYLDQVRTPSGVRNHPLHDSGRAITAALFLGEFVAEDVPWVHCDMTGPAWSGDASGDGATGFGTRTLLRLLTAGAGHAAE